jgi:hypothetical protein
VARPCDDLLVMTYVQYLLAMTDEKWRIC